ncbi:MAG: TRAP transporter large permease [Thermovirgaceae bacterium]
MALFLFASFAVFLLLSVPIAISLGAASFLGIALKTTVPTFIVAQRMVGGINKFPILALVFFILAGNVMTEGGVSRKLVRFANAFVGKVSGGLAMVSTLAAMFFGAISGSSAATTAAIGSIMIPYMKEAGYKQEFSAAVIACSGLLGLLIPPSGTMILYAIIADVSILRLFIAGIVPGVVIGASLMTTEYWISRKRGYKAFIMEEEQSPRGKVCRDSLFALLSPVLILGGIYSGLFTPTEAAGVAVFYGLLVGGVIYRDLSFKSLYRACYSSALSSAVIMFLIAAASIFAWLLATQQIPQHLVSVVTSFSESTPLILLLINITLLVAGTFLDNVAAITLLTPILHPLIMSLGVDPVFFGVVMITNLAIGQVTPPVGMNLFVASNISKVPIEKIARQALPFLVVLIADLMLITYVPGLVTFLPDLLLK